MFLRASKRSFQPETHRHWQYSSDVLRLPWLCPFLYSVALYPRKASTIAGTKSTTKSRLLRPCIFQPAVTISKCQKRRLASAATAVNDIPNDTFIPFEGSQSPLQPASSVQSPWLRQSSLSTILEPISPIIINNAITSEPPRRRSRNAISADVAEIIQTLHACIHVDQLHRAATLMRRLNAIMEPGDPELLKAHNDYLRELVHKHTHAENEQGISDVYKWFEVDLRGANVTPDAYTHALMIQAAFQLSNPKKFHRTVKRVFLLTHEAEMLDDTLAILQTMCAEQEFGRITRIAFSCFNQVREPHIEDTPGVESIQEPVRSLVRDFSDLPEVKETQQKGLGLVTLKRALSIFSEPTPIKSSNAVSNTEDKGNISHAFERQKRLETDTYHSAVRRWREQGERLNKLGISAALSKGAIGASMWQWHEKLVSLIEEEISKVKKVEATIPKAAADIQRCRYGPFLQVLPPEKLSAITILSCMNMLLKLTHDSKKGAVLAAVLGAVGGAIQDEYLAATLKKRHVQNGKKFPERLRLLAMIRRPQLLESSTKMMGNSQLLHDDAEGLEWTKTIKVTIGAVLLSHLIEAATMEVSRIDPQTRTELRVTQPVFMHYYQHTGGKRQGMLRFNGAMYDKLKAEPSGCALSKHLPMIVEPKPWTSYWEGAFLEHRVSAVRVYADDTSSKNYAMAASNNGDMQHMFAGLNALARTPWRVNRDLFEVMLLAWNSGEGMGKIVPENVEAIPPPEPAASDGLRARYKWIEAVRKIENHKASIKSQRCFLNFQLDIARAYLNEVFYFPHNLDFRGRAYPMVPFFNHMGADPCRALLVFSEGKELGESGLRWLKIHLSNLYGYDKASLEERRQFTDDQLSNILDSATNPLDGRRWWLQADKPWQCLGACIELKKALDEPDPHRFISHQPIHQDGTCNGLQHYAALGGDPLGAKQVNLTPGSRPADIYSGVADLVKAEVANDAAQGDKLAALLNGKLTRKVVKQTVMTSVYGVTFRGAMLQVAVQLEAIFRGLPDREKAPDLSNASVYISRKIFKALSTMFIRAQDIQHWLAECASRTSKSISADQVKNFQAQAEGKVAPQKGKSKKPFDLKTQFRTPVIWTTPLRMPIVQPYRKSSRKHIETNLQRISLNSPVVSDPVNSRKQVQSFPPNFIHSLDATHMMLTALKCNEIGLTFASVHDSFWTHASDVDTMNIVIRDAFIRMHSEDIIGRLRAEFNARCKGSWLFASINRCSAAAKKINEWRCKVGGGRKLDELLMEKRRLDLLASDNPEERLKGQSMVTAWKIFEEFANESDLTFSKPMDYATFGARKSRRSAKQKAGKQVVVENPDDPGSLTTSVGHGQPSGDADQVSVIGDFDDSEISMPSLGDSPHNSEADGTVESLFEEYGQDEESEKDETKHDEKTKERPDSSVWFWLPMKFPAVPKKGNFDVSTLRDSQYFFS